MKKKFSKFLIFAAILASLLLLTILVVAPIYAICNEEQVLKASLNNIYIETDFVGWSENYLDGIGKIMLPNDWVLVQDGFTYVINDLDGQQIAKGITILLDDNTKDRDIFLASVFGIYPESAEFKSDSNYVSIHSSRYGLCEVSNSSSKRAMVSFDIRNKEYWSLMLFPQKSQTSELLDIVQAISFSQLMLQ